VRYNHKCRILLVKKCLFKTAEYIELLSYKISVYTFVVIAAMNFLNFLIFQKNSGEGGTVSEHTKALMHP
jgi:hypothetical protein